MSEFEFDMDRVLAACTHGPEFRGICAACTRAAVLREVLDAIDATYESSLNWMDFREKAVKRLDAILALFRAGGRFAVEGEEGE